MDKATLVRTIVLAIALFNQVLIATGLNPIPGTEEKWGEIVSSVFTFVAAAVSWFKNNYVTAKGRQQKEVLKRAGLTNSK
ncbi:SPP1 family holin [Melghiribacillus thermohalophilus]|uniref:SPP1 family holin n=1 Tax=Melghiribacillus thermohalophilus TaxID=1324956 RepID=A0A4R3N545_9BACI|nr:SPP1 family holin [Melghiribacillus thermohalophilus]